MSDIVKEGTVLVFEDDEMSGDRQVVRVFITQKDFVEDGYTRHFANRYGELDAPLLIRDGLIKEVEFRDSIMPWDDFKLIENKPTPTTKEPKKDTPKQKLNKAIRDAIYSYQDEVGGSLSSMVVGNDFDVVIETHS